jgi:hypothetical protein
MTGHKLAIMMQAKQYVCLSLASLSVCEERLSTNEALTRTRVESDTRDSISTGVKQHPTFPKNRQMEICHNIA